MKPSTEKIEIARQLQAKINMMQGLGKTSGTADAFFEPFSAAFPGNIFPTGAIHEFISYEMASAAATSGFITAVAGKLMKSGGLIIWIGSERKVFPSALMHFGLKPDQVVFVNAPHTKTALWIIEEALKCEALTAVIAEVKEIGFTDSRRLQLAVENSRVTGFIHRYCPRTENTTASTARWKISPLPSSNENDLPGVGYSSWNVQLIKVRNGRPHYWQIGWNENSFITLTDKQYVLSSLNVRHTG